MTITILGSGTSGGIPMIACNCEVCSSDDFRDKRLRSSILIQENNKNIVIDTGPDFRQQMLRANIKKLDAIIFTHAHRDHTAGLDDIRAFNYFQSAAINLYVNTETEHALRKEYTYIFSDKWYPGLPQVNFINIQNQLFSIGDINILPIEVIHFQMKVLGFRIQNFTYITDANFISTDEKEKIKGTEVLVLNALRKEKHISHFNLEEALQLVAELAPNKTYLTHLSHQMGSHGEIEQMLPPGVFLAYDGLQIFL